MSVILTALGFFRSERWGKNIQAAAYNGARTVVSMYNVHTRTIHIRFTVSARLFCFFCMYVYVIPKIINNLYLLMYLFLLQLIRYHVCEKNSDVIVN